MTITQQGEKLLPCPFCGGEPKLHDSSMGWLYVICGCDAAGPDKPSAQQAIAAWSTRTTLALPLVEALDNLLGAIDEGQDIDPINSDYYADARAALAQFRAE